MLTVLAGGVWIPLDARPAIRTRTFLPIKSRLTLSRPNAAFQSTNECGPVAESGLPFGLLSLFPFITSVSLFDPLHHCTALCPILLGFLSIMHLHTSIIALPSPPPKSVSFANNQASVPQASSIKWVSYYVPMRLTEAFCRKL